MWIRVILRTLAALLLASAAIVAPSPALAAAGDVRRMADAYGKASADMKAEQWEAALRRLTAALNDPAFSSLPAATQGAIYSMAAQCAMMASKQEVAYPYAVKATDLGDATPLVWYYRLGLDIQFDHSDDAVKTIEIMLDRYSDMLNSTPFEWFRALAGRLKASGKADVRARFLEMVTGGLYRPTAIDADLDYFRRDYAELLFDQKRGGDVVRVIASIENPSVLMFLSLDSRFRSAFPADYDFRGAVERDLARWRAVAAAHADALGPPINIARRLRQLDRPEEALAALKTVDPVGRHASPYVDQDAQLNWWWQELSSVYLSLGRYTDAIDALEKGGGVSERGALNVSQVINIASVQNYYAHPQDALRSLAVMSDSQRHMSTFGEMQFHNARGCARGALGDMAAARQDLDFIRAHDDIDRSSLVEVLLCTGQLDAAAAALVKRLDDPREQSKALMSLSDFDEPRIKAPPDPVSTGLVLLAKRADVAAAIKRAGGTRKFHVADDGR